MMAKRSNNWALLLFLSNSAWLMFYLSQHKTVRWSMPCVSTEDCLDLRIDEVMPPQDDPYLASRIKKKFLIPPDQKTPYNLDKPVTDADSSQYGQLAVIKELFGHMYDGFFVDCGAHNGEYMSNTLWLEKRLGWNGLLIEVEPKTFELLKSKNRKAWIANVCLSPTIYPGKQTFYFNVNKTDSSGSGLKEITYNGVKKQSSAYCVPFYTLLLALNEHVVDVFSLDIEGAELDILKTIPFDKIIIKMLVIESRWIPTVGKLNGAQQLNAFMTGKGYKLYRNIRNHDAIYVHSSYLPVDFIEDPVIKKKD